MVGVRACVRGRARARRRERHEHGDALEAQVSSRAITPLSALVELLVHSVHSNSRSHSTDALTLPDRDPLASLTSPPPTHPASSTRTLSPLDTPWPPSPHWPRPSSR